jgi:hypothetical protein
MHTTHALSPQGQQRYLIYSSETPTFYQNDYETVDVPDGKPIIALTRLLRYPWKKGKGYILLLCPGHYTSRDEISNYYVTNDPAWLLTDADTKVFLYYIMHITLHL